MAERYDPEQIEYALTTLRFFRDDVKKTAEFLRIPAKLLNRWRIEAEKKATLGQAIETRLFAPGGRPMPPKSMLEDGAGMRFEPAPELEQWARKAFIDPRSPLFNEEHEHLADAVIGFLWTNVPCRRKGMEIAGTAEMPNVQGSTWTKARMEFQLLNWFHDDLDFLITLDAEYCARASDARFCALTEHEMLHCAQAVDPFGEPMFTLEERPIFRMRGHDVEEFVSIVRRYGAGNAAGATAQLVAAASRPPLIAEADIASVCGACLR